MLATAKNKIIVLSATLLLSIMAFGTVAAITADDANASFNYACGQRGGYTYHAHYAWNSAYVYHYTFYYPGYNYFYDWSWIDGWVYRGWAYCH